jgi:hypothetical protein
MRLYCAIVLTIALVGAVTSANAETRRANPGESCGSLRGACANACPSSGGGGSRGKCVEQCKLSLDACLKTGTWGNAGNEVTGLPIKP